MLNARGRRAANFAEFWPFYLSEHRFRRTRQLHFIGSTLALLCLALALWKSWKFLGLGIMLGYGFAWIGHFMFEHKKPASFRRPAYSFLADWKMWCMMLTGKLGQEYARLGIRME